MTSAMSPAKRALMCQVELVRVLPSKKRRYFDEITKKWTRANGRRPIVVECQAGHETQTTFPSTTAGQSVCSGCGKRLIWRDPLKVKSIREDLAMKKIYI